MWPFDWHIYIRPWPILEIKVKIMQISQRMTNRAKHYYFPKYYVACQLSISIFRVDWPILKVNLAVGTVPRQICRPSCVTLWSSRKYYLCCVWQIVIIMTYTNLINIIHKLIRRIIMARDILSPIRLNSQLPIGLKDINICRGPSLIASDLVTD